MNTSELESRRLLNEDRAAEARHGGRHLTMALNTAFDRPHMWAGRWFQGNWVRAALGGSFESSGGLTVAAAWMCVDGVVSRGFEKTWSEHIGQLRAAGFDRSKPELLDEALRWPIIRVALGLPL